MDNSNEFEVKTSVKVSNEEVKNVIFSFIEEREELEDSIKFQLMAIAEHIDNMPEFNK